MSERLRGLLVILSLCAGLSLLGGAGPSVPPARAASRGCPWMNRGLSSNARAAMLVSAMTLSDKIAMVHQSQPDGFHYGSAGWIPAIARLCVPDLVLNDAGAGVGDQQTGTTAFPAPIAQSASWDPALQARFGAALGQEALAKGINVQLAPGIETDRVPMNGRNWEYASEDPFLSGQFASAVVRGIQSQHVIATIKHFIANSQETNRMTDSSDVGERTLEEIYAPQYEAAVRGGGAGAVMCSYNRINGVYACENPATLGMLDHQFGFDGFVVSDWNATHSTVGSAKAGLDMEMSVTPGTYFGSALAAAVQAGQVPMRTLNDMVMRILRSMFRVGLFDHQAAAQPGAFAANVSTPAHVALARTVAEAGTVLLKNQGSILPLTGPGKTIAVIGPGAGQAGAENEYGGQGSGHVPEFGSIPVVSPQTAITQRALRAGDTVLYADGSSSTAAAATARLASVAVVFAGDSESEGTDRPDLTLRGGTCTLGGCTPQTSDQNALIAAVAAANPHTVVVLNTGGPVLMPWLASVRGLFEAWYPGQEDGNAISALLFGDVDPSGRLPETFPAALSDLPLRSPSQWPGVADRAGVPHSIYSEGLLVGYRWYDARHIAPLFPFGFGLDYTSFRYGAMALHAGGAPGAVATATVRVTNTGARAGADVPQLYLSDPASTGEPPRQLKADARISLAPGHSTAVRLSLGARALAWWKPSRHAWTVTPGCYGLAIGPNERDLVTAATLAVNGARCPGAAASVTVHLPGPPAPACRSLGRRIGARRLGALRLGMTPAQIHRGLRSRGWRRRGAGAYACSGQGTVRFAFAGASLLRDLPHRRRARLRGRAVGLLATDRHASLDGISPGARVGVVQRRLRTGARLRVAGRDWYVVGARGWLIEARRGVVIAVGVGDPRVLANRRATRRLLGDLA